MIDKLVGKMGSFVAKDFVSAIVVTISLYSLWGGQALNRLEYLVGWPIVIWALIYVWRKKTAYSPISRRLLVFARWLGMYISINAAISLVDFLKILSVVKWDDPDKLLQASVPFIVGITVLGMNVVIFCLLYRMCLEWSETLKTHSMVNFSDYRQRTKELVKLTILTILIVITYLFVLKGISMP